MPSQAEVRQQLEKLTRTDAKCAIIGTVADFFETPRGGFYARFEIFDSFTAIVWLITHGYCTGLSLTHVVPNSSTGTILPYELTVCERPARPHCYVVAGSPDAMLLHAYKGGLQGGSIRDRSDTLSAPPHVPIMTDASQIPADMAVDDTTEVVGDTHESKIERALASMNPGDAQLVAGRFESMMTAVEAARKEAADATEEKEKAIKERMESDLNTGLLKSYVENLKAGIGADMCRTFHLDNVRDTDLDTTNIHQFKHTMQRVVHAASHALMMNNASALAPPAQNKRKMEAIPFADEAPAPVVVASVGAAAAADAAPADARELLRRAIADQWSVTA